MKLVVQRRPLSPAFLWHSGEARGTLRGQATRAAGTSRCVCTSRWAFTRGHRAGAGTARGTCRPFPPCPSPYGTAVSSEIPSPACSIGVPKRFRGPPPSPAARGPAARLPASRLPHHISRRQLTALGLAGTPHRCAQDAARCRRRTGSAAECSAVAPGRRRWVTASGQVGGQADGAGGGARSP